MGTPKHRVNMHGRSALDGSARWQPADSFMRHLKVSVLSLLCEVVVVRALARVTKQTKETNVIG